MKKVLAWMKSNLAVVILSALIVLMLPAALVVSQMWNSSLRTKRQSEIDGVMRDLDASKTTYKLPPLAPGASATSFDLPAPNAATTEFFKAQKAKIEGQTAALLAAAEEINKQGHRVLLEGVLPKPEGSLKTIEFAEALVGKGEKPSAYKTLLDSIRAGGPADPAPIVESMNETLSQAMERARSETNRTELSSEEQSALTARFVEKRLTSYRDHARTIGVYASVDVLPADLPRSVPNEPPDVASVFRWQMDLWFVADLLRIVGNANTIDGRSVGVDQAVVKRIESISIDPMATLAAAAGGQQGSSSQPPAHAPTLTGRAPTNPNFDVRHADLDLIVASEKLPELINAVSRTNFMTVVGMDLSEATPWADLEQGFYYGPDHVIRVRLRVESVWLRSWITPLIPESLKPAFGAEAAAAAAAPAAAPPPPPAPRAAPSGGGARNKSAPPKQKGGRRGGGE